MGGIIFRNQYFLKRVNEGQKILWQPDLTSSGQWVITKEPSNEIIESKNVFWSSWFSPESESLSSQLWIRFRDAFPKRLRSNHRIIWGCRKLKHTLNHTNKKKKVVISKCTLTCISLQTMWTQNISCFVNHCCLQWLCTFETFIRSYL